MKLKIFKLCSFLLVLVSCHKTETLHFEQARIFFTDSITVNNKNYHLNIEAEWIFKYPLADFKNDPKAVNLTYQKVQKKLSPSFTPDMDFSNYLKNLNDRIEIRTFIHDQLNKDIKEIMMGKKQYSSRFFYHPIIYKYFVKDEAFQKKIKEKIPAFFSPYKDYLFLEIKYTLAHSPTMYLNYIDQIQTNWHSYYQKENQYFRIKPLLAHDRLNTVFGAIIYQDSDKLEDLIFTTIAHQDPSLLNSNRLKLENIILVVLNDWFAQNYPKNPDFRLKDFIFEEGFNFKL